MKIIQNETISAEELREMSKKMFGNLVKAVVDVEREIIALDAELHADQEVVLLEQGSQQKDLWGINIYPDLTGEAMIEFDSMINLRPNHGNFSRGVDDAALRVRLTAIVFKFIHL